MQGKYRDPMTVPETARLVKYKGRYAEAESRYGPKPNVVEAVDAYCRLAEAAGVEPYELAIRFAHLSRKQLPSGNLLRVWICGSPS